MALAIHLSTYVAGYPNPVRWDLHETLSGALVDSHTEAGPHDQVYNFSFVDNIRDIVYTVKFYDVPPPAVLGNLIKGHDVTPTTSHITDAEYLELIVDGGEPEDPTSGTSTVTIPALIGKRIKLIQRGIGPYRELRDAEYTFDDTTGEIDLLGAEFNSEDTWFVKILSEYVVNPPGSSNGSQYRDVVLIDADTTLSSTDAGKKFIVDGLGSVVTITFPAIGDNVAKIPFFFESIGTIHNNVVLKADTGETILAQAVAHNTFILGKGEQAELIILDGVFYGFTDSNDIKKVGSLDWVYALGLNQKWANGTEYNVADYPRVKKAMDAGKCGTVVSYATWVATALVNGIATQINKGFWALSDDQTKFLVPDWRNKYVRALRFSDITSDDQRYSQGPGGYQHDEIRAHNHTIATTNGAASGSANADPVRGSISGTVNTRGGEGAGKTIGEYGGDETRVIGYGLIPALNF